jgi:hypothetical protein
VKHEVAVRQFQIVHDAGGLEVRVALDAAANASPAQRRSSS